MRNMGKYCKAYQVKRFREFSGWTENTKNLRQRREEIEGNERSSARELSDNDILYLQENYTVTDGIFLDEHVIYEKVTPEWLEFCRNALAFELPEFERKKDLSSVNAEGLK